MKITLISFDNWGFNEKIKIALEKENNIVNHIDFSKYKYKYPSKFHKIFNFFYKILFRKNLKTEYYGKTIIDKLETIKEKQDIILTLKGDFISPEYAYQIKNYTKKSIAFFNDNIKRYPKIPKVLPCFDEIYSFEKEDCRKYNLKFKTNFIYNFQEKKIEDKKNNIEVFNISTYGNRTDLFIKIGKNLKHQNIPYKFFIYDKNKKLKDNKFVESIQQTISLNEINNYIEKSNVLLDIHRKNQNGLSFRVFESLGLHKKLITTNSDIKNYDFYNANNILIIDSKEPKINVDFFKNPYTEIPKEILYNYQIKNWFNEFIVNKNE